MSPLIFLGVYLGSGFISALITAYVYKRWWNEEPESEQVLGALMVGVLWPIVAMCGFFYVAIVLPVKGVVKGVKPQRQRNEERRMAEYSKEQQRKADLKRARELGLYPEDAPDEAFQYSEDTTVGRLRSGDFIW